MLYLFGYQFKDSVKANPELVRFIDECKPQAHVMENVWLLDSSDLPFNLQRQLKEYVGVDDEFYLVDVSKSIVAWSGLEGEIADFIERFTEPVEQDVSRRLLTIASDGPVDLEQLGNLADSKPRPLLANLWQVETTTTPEQVVTALRGSLAEGGRLLVADVSLAPAAWSHLPEDSAYAAVAYTRTEQGSDQVQEF
ncbi:hypothetical protein [Gloeobacter kilaueensis]|uniref:Uncharacterized protein n=1 Tax=Gloeobacter kilaueensis (strain ATCC BAA-2537 / CCAP 1431/1 / ULC 316 / JS1) TaxID=1183438 RepID=U5QDS2_GLOK1|nr:hypothetical protein [Gloeobacter kilaueensis]AGY57102.1 hypothetical protein GKIL_0856 [Gloeobacter kilaueensis JS1]